MDLSLSPDACVYELSPLHVNFFLEEWHTSFSPEERFFLALFLKGSCRCLILEGLETLEGAELMDRKALGFGWLDYLQILRVAPCFVPPQVK
jgi:hypothetical protein